MYRTVKTPLPYYSSIPHLLGCFIFVNSHCFSLANPYRVSGFVLVRLTPGLHRGLFTENSYRVLTYINSLGVAGNFDVSQLHGSCR